MLDALRPNGSGLGGCVSRVQARGKVPCRVRGRATVIASGEVRGRARVGVAGASVVREQARVGTGKSIGRERGVVGASVVVRFGRESVFMGQEQELNLGHRGQSRNRSWITAAYATAWTCWRTGEGKWCEGRAQTGGEWGKENKDREKWESSEYVIRQHPSNARRQGTLTITLTRWLYLYLDMTRS